MTHASQFVSPNLFVWWLSSGCSNNFIFNRRISMGEYETLLYFKVYAICTHTLWDLMYNQAKRNMFMRCQWQYLYYMEKRSIAFWYYCQGLVLQQNLSQNFSFSVGYQYSFKLFMHRSYCITCLNVSFLIVFGRLCKEICEAQGGLRPRIEKSLAD